MSDGKRCTKQDIVIVSIKPRRPEYPSNQNKVLVKELHLEWDKLDAYYRGQILKLKNQSKSQQSSRSRKSSKSSRSSSKKSSTRRSSVGNNQLTELFGDENIPLDDLEISEDDDQENLIRISAKRDIRKDRSRKKSRAKDENKDDDHNYLSIPRDNFRIEFAISLKTRTPLHDQSDNSGYISPVKVEPYKPPVAIGFNGVHIQKILYHKTEGVANHTSPTTTALTPDKPPETDDTDASSPLLIRTESKSDIRTNNGTVFNRNHLSSQNKATLKSSSSKDNKSSITILAPMKRKVDNGPVSSTTTANEEDLFEETQPKKRKDKTIKDKASLTLSSAATGNDKMIMTIKKSQCPPPIKSLSITDKIIKKAKQLPPEMMERERQRLIESQKRKTYASAKGNEQEVIDSVDASLKAFEMIWNGSPLSPIRSPYII